MAATLEPSRFTPASVLLLALAGGACGGSTLPPQAPAPGAGYGDGRRLQSPIWFTADGFSMRQGTIHDRLRDEDCTFRRAADERMRCMPATGAWASALFGDAACTQPLASGSGGTPKGPYAEFFLPWPPCQGPSPVEYRELGAEVADGEPVYALSNGACVPSVSSKREVHYRTGRVLGPELFVAADEVVVPAPTAGGWLAEVRLRAEDGAWFEQGLIDTRDGTRCEPSPTSDGETRCLPVARYWANPGDDLGRADCSGPRIASQHSTCNDGNADVISEVSTACSQHRVLYSPGAAWQGQQRFHVAADGACMAGTNVVSPAVEIGAELAPSLYARLELQNAGTQRLRAPRYVDAGGASVAQGSFAYDSAMGEACAFSLAPDRQVRCTPIALFAAFEDAACTLPVGVSLTTDGCQPPENFVIVGGRLHQRGPAVPAAAALYTLGTDGGGCVLASYLSADFQYFAVGPEASIELVTATAR